MSFKASKSLEEHEQQVALLHFSVNIASKTKLKLDEKRRMRNKFCGIYRDQHILSQTVLENCSTYTPGLILLTSCSEIAFLGYFITSPFNIYLVCKVNEKLLPMKMAIKKPALTSIQGNYTDSLHCALFSHFTAICNAQPSIHSVGRVSIFLARFKRDSKSLLIMDKHSKYKH